VSPTAGPTAFTGLSEPLPSKRTYVGLGYVDVPYEALGAPALSSAVLATRVWDVAPDGKALLMTRGVYRLDFRGYDPITGTARVPLFGNQWDLDPGHKIRIDLEQSDVPYLKPPAPDATASLRIGSPNPDAPDLGSPRLVLPTRSAGTTPLAGAGI
jgi:predicted acyl esterase